mgnify:FL=1
MTEVTKLLSAIEDGDQQATNQLLPLVYQELRKLAARKLSDEMHQQTLQPTMLVHEAYLLLVDVANPQKWNGKGHFFAAAAEAMRRILIEKARQRKSLKRGGVIEHTTVDELPIATPSDPVELLALDEALTEFEREWPEKAKLVKLRYFAGFTTAEAARALGLSIRTAERTWTYAKAWLLQAIDDESSTELRK